MESRPLIEPPPAMDGVLDYKGRPISKPGTGGWSAVCFILGIEMAERVAFNGIMFNLISYMTGPLGQSTASAAVGVAVWSGVSMMLPIVGAFIADSFLTRYSTIILCSLLYVLGLGLLSLSAVLPNICDENADQVACRPSTFSLGLFYFSLYLVAFAESGHRPCVQAFGADQFDEADTNESISRSSFFNWWLFALGMAMAAAFFVLSNVQDNVNWGLGFGIPCVLMGVALIAFLLGSRLYRCYAPKVENPYFRIVEAFAKLSRRQLFSSNKSETETASDSSNQTKFEDVDGSLMARQIEEAKGLLRVFPIWVTCLPFTVITYQCSTLFTKQGATLNRSIASNFQIPPAALQSITSLTYTIFVVVYDLVFVPLARNLTGIPSGITKLQRIGAGFLISVIVMVNAAVVETKRLQTAKEFGLVDEPSSVLPMNIAWLFPQYILMGFAELFAVPGMQEFFYDQMPDGLRSFGVALCLSTFGMGGFVNGILIGVMDKASTVFGGGSWFSNNLNRAHLDYFYWLLAGLELSCFVLFICFAKAYEYKKKGEFDL
ncbi:hypothetical protein HPP92_011937 [Vanilla planifolia]|uniref:Uncharacterized protein n=1 Tax=Vanilla planifolia TaxID=51239 RepID=A0A835R2S2_VANPL|nr:hypothetical protein HPP92_011937 [Vanilla planifolia]